MPEALKKKPLAPRRKAAPAQSKGLALPVNEGKSLGRRPGKTITREAILDAAEETFALMGFAGSSMREIAAKADVNQALLHHYFGTKENLFQSVFLRRGQELVQRRIELLEQLEARKAKPRVVDIVKAFLTPAFDLKRHGGAGGIAFLQLQSRMHSEMQVVTKELRTAVYDRAMHHYIASLARALPQLDAATIYWRLTFAIGAYTHTISDHHRLKEFSQGKCDPEDLDESFEQLTAFIVGGLTGK